VKADPPCGCLFGGGHAHATVRKLLTYDDPTWQAVNTWWLATVLRMARLAGDDLDSVRCVFWFE
jgi:hypothetical protein